MSVGDRFAIGHKDYPAAVGGPTPDRINSRMVCQPFRISAGGRDYINVGISGDGSGKSDLRAIRREVRIGLHGGSCSEAASLTASTRNHPQITRVFESHQVTAHRRLAKK